MSNFIFPRKDPMHRRTTRIGLVALAAALITSAGCQDLQVDNPNAPDRDRAIANPQDVENIIIGAFPTVWAPLHRGTPTSGNTNVGMLWSAWGREGTTTSMLGGIWEAATREPLQPLFNELTINASTGPIGPVNAWLDLHRAASSANDGLAAIANQIEMPTEAATKRAMAMALFVRGMALGNLALGWGQATVLDENTEFGSDAAKVVRENIRPYPEVLDAALASFSEAADIAASTNFTIPAEWFRTFEGVSSAELIRVANSFKAKYMVYNARSPEERDNVDWNEVLRLTESGVTANFAPVISQESGGLVSHYIRQSQLNSRGGLQQSRADYDLIGPADVSGTWQEYLATPLHLRDKIMITTPDRRITGPTPESNGTYFRFVVNPGGAPDSQYGFVTDRGLYNFSNYQWFRYGGSFYNIAVPLMGVDENRLIRAEALLRLGREAEAAELINVTRTRTQRIGTTNYPGLPAVTAAGVPEADDCVPQTRTGACGSLLDALIYERRVELYGVDAMRAYADNRGFGLLREGTPIHMPIPARELAALDLPVYTFGGVGGNCAFGSTCVLPEIN